MLPIENAFKVIMRVSNSLLDEIFRCTGSQQGKPVERVRMFEILTGGNQIGNEYLAKSIENSRAHGNFQGGGRARSVSSPCKRILTTALGDHRRKSGHHVLHFCRVFFGMEYDHYYRPFSERETLREEVLRVHSSVMSTL